MIELIGVIWREYEKIENPISSSNTMVRWHFITFIYTVVENKGIKFTELFDKHIPDTIDFTSILRLSYRP